MTTLDEEAKHIYLSPIDAVISDKEVLACLKKLRIEYIQDLLNYFPKRYIDLSKCVPIGNTSLNKKNVVCGEVHEVKERNLDGGLVYDVTLRDKTGIILFTIYDKKQLSEVFDNSFLIASGEVYFDYGFKHMKHQILINASSLVKSKIMPVYETRFVCDQLTIRESIRQALYRIEYLKSDVDEVLGEDMSLAQALRNIHFANDIDSLKKAIHRIKIEELSSVDLSILQKIILGEFPEKFDRDEYCNFDLRIYNMSDIGDALEYPRDVIDRQCNVYILSPLLGLNTEKRDELTYFRRKCEIDTALYYPKICIESASECGEHTDKLELLKRKNYYQGIMNAPDGSIFVTDSLVNLRNLCQSDCLIIEDSDRFSLPALYGILKRCKCRAILLYRSKRPEARKRLFVLKQAKTYSDILDAEINSRYAGDILGNRDPQLRALKLINLGKDKALIDKMKDR